MGHHDHQQARSHFRSPVEEHKPSSNINTSNHHMFAFTKRQRAVAEIERRRGQIETYTTPLPRDAADLKPFLSDFYRNIIFAQQDEMRAELQKYDAVNQWYQTLVVQQKRVPYEDFWQRYYYRTASVERVQAELEAEDQEKKRLEKGNATTTAAASAFSMSSFLAGSSKTASNVVSTFVGDKLTATAAAAASSTTTATAAPPSSSSHSSIKNTAAAKATASSLGYKSKSSNSDSPSSRTETTATLKPTSGGDGVVSSVKATTKTIKEDNNEKKKATATTTTPQEQSTTNTTAAAVTTTIDGKDTTASAKSAAVGETATITTTARWNDSTSWTPPRPPAEETKLPIDNDDNGVMDQQVFDNIWPVSSADTRDSVGKDSDFVSKGFVEWPTNDTTTTETSSSPLDKRSKPVPSVSSPSSKSSGSSSSSSPQSPSHKKAPPKEAFESLLPAYYKKMKRHDGDKVEEEDASRLSFIREFPVTTTSTTTAAASAALEKKNGGTDIEDQQSQSIRTPKSTDRDEKKSSDDSSKSKSTAKPVVLLSPPSPTDDDRFWDHTEPPPPENSFRSTSPSTAAAGVTTPPHKARDKVASIRDSVTKGEFSIPPSSPPSSKRTVALVTTTTTTTPTATPSKGGGGGGSSDELRYGTSPGDDAPSVPKRDSDDDYDDSPLVAAPAKSGNFGAPSSSQQHKSDWQERIEQVNVDALSSPSFVDKKTEENDVRKPANAKSEGLFGLSMATLEEASNKVLSKAFDRKAEGGTSSRSTTAVGPTTVGGPQTVRKISAHNVISSRLAARKKETTTSAGGSIVKASTSHKEAKDNATGTKTVETAYTSALSTKQASKEGVQPKATRPKGQVQDQAPKESVRWANSNAEGRKGVASLVAKYEKKSSATQEDSVPKTAAAAARDAAPETSHSDSESKIAIVLSVSVLLIAAAAGIFLSLAPTTNLGDWFCGPVRPMRTLNSLPKGVHSISGEAPWFAPSSVKQEAFDWVCGPERIRTAFEWTEHNSKHRSLDIVDAHSGKRLLHQKKILSAMFDIDNVEYSTEKFTKKWIAAWRFV